MDSSNNWEKTTDYFQPKPLKRNLDVQSEILNLSFDFESKYVAASYGDGQVKIYTHLLKHHTSCQIQTLQQDIPPLMTTIKFRPQITTLDHDEELRNKYAGKCLLTVSSEGHICHWNGMSGKLQHVISHENNSLNACDWTPDGLKFTAAGENMRIYVYDEVTKQLISTMYSRGLQVNGHQMPVFATKFLPNDGNLLLTGGWDRIIKIYDLRCGYPVGQIIGPQISGDALDIADDTIIAGSNRQDRPLSIFSLNMRKRILDIEFESPHSRDKVAGFVYGARFSKDRDSSIIFACGAGRNEFKVFDNDTDGQGKYRQLGALSGHTDPYLACDTSPNGEKVAIGTAGGNIMISEFKLGNDEDKDADDKGKSLRSPTKKISTMQGSLQGTLISNQAAAAVQEKD